MDLRPIIEAKARGEALSPQQITAFVQAAANGSGSDEQLAALLMAVLIRGMGVDERVAYTFAMMRSGRVLDFSDLGCPTVDKHSTGGVGDKVSLVWAPLMAAAGMAVPMISGRGLGHTGGTLDKLEAIPGFRCDLDAKAMRRVLDDVGCVITGQTDDLVPADKRLYSLRSRTATVRSIDHIAASIMSKKLAEGTGHLVLDVKVGRAAFLTGYDEAAALARVMVDIGKGTGRPCVALLTDMDKPLGKAVGNGLEVIEALECLDGRGPPDLRALVLALAEEALVLVGRAPDDEAGRDAAKALLSGLLDDGSAMAKFLAMVAAQGGDLAALDPEHYGRLLSDRGCGTAAGGAPVKHAVFRAPADGFVVDLNPLKVGMAAYALGAGRGQAGEAPIAGVGIRLLQPLGSQVAAGSPLARVHHCGLGLAASLEQLAEAIVIGAAPPVAPAQILGLVT